jgi:hypothetical protein
VLPAPLVAGQTYFVAAIPNGDEFTVAATPGGSGVTWNLNPTDSATYAATATLLDGAYPIPEASDGIFAQNRLFLIDGKDTVAVSDIGDFTRYVPTQSEFRINQGDAYTLKYLYLFNESTLLLFKNGNVSKVLGVTGDLSGATGPLNVTQAYGMAAPSVADIGTDVYWLNSELRVTSLNLTQLNKEQGTNQALSDPLLRTFGRINPGVADRARLAVFDGYLHVALPLDDALVVDPTNLVPAGTKYTAGFGTDALFVTTPGQIYRWSAGPNDGQIVSANTATPYAGDCIFTATGNYVNFLRNPNVPEDPNLPVTATLQRVIAQNCNTAVAVYDFLNQAWCGTDESQVTCVVDWLKFTYNGKQQLAFIGADGYFHLYADGYEDETVQPGDLYVDLFCDQNSLLWGGTGAQDTLQINGGTLITQQLGNNFNTATTWGINVPSMGASLWQDAGGNGGYNPAALNPWSAPNVTITPIADGIRLVPTNGVLPTIKINGTAVPTTAGIVSGTWVFKYYFDWHSGISIQPVDIVSRVLTRAYPCKSFQSYAKALTTGLRTDFKRYTCAQLHLAGWSPNYSISTVTQGQGDEEPYVTGETRNYLNYFTPATAAPWNPSNQSDDFHNPNREDYAYPETGAGILLGSGVNFDQLQEYTDTVPLSERGIYVQIDLQNTAGHLELAGLELEAQMGEQNSGPSVKN